MALASPKEVQKHECTGELFSYVKEKLSEYSVCTLGIHSEEVLYHNIQDDSFLDKLCCLDCHFWDLVILVFNLIWQN